MTYEEFRRQLLKTLNLKPVPLTEASLTDAIKKIKLACPQPRAGLSRVSLIVDSVKPRREVLMLLEPNESVESVFIEAQSQQGIWSKLQPIEELAPGALSRALKHTLGARRPEYWTLRDHRKVVLLAAADKTYRFLVTLQVRN